MREKKVKIYFMLHLLFIILPFFSCSFENENKEKFSIMTWNVFLNKGDSNACFEILNNQKSDFYIFQEANDLFYEQVLNRFVNKVDKLNYELINTLVEGKTCYMPIIYDANIWDVIECDVEPLVDKYQTAKGKTLSYGVFIHRKEEKILSIVNYHGVKCLSSYQGYENYSENKLKEIENQWHIGNVNQGLQLIEKLKYKYGEHPIIFGGDCNFNSSTEPYAILKNNGYLSGQELFEDEYKTTHILGEKPVKGLSIDHLFVDKLTTIYEYKKIVNNTTLIASDHIPIYVIFDIN